MSVITKTPYLERKYTSINEIEVDQSIDFWLSVLLQWYLEDSWLFVFTWVTLSFVFFINRIDSAKVLENFEKQILLNDNDLWIQFYSLFSVKHI